MSDTKIAASFRVSLTALLPKQADRRSSRAWAWCASMLRFGEGVEAESASLRVDPSVYPRHGELITHAEGGNRPWPSLGRRSRVNRPAEADPKPLARAAQLPILTIPQPCCGGSQPIA
jgi:hypothetical protein